MDSPAAPVRHGSWPPSPRQAVWGSLALGVAALVLAPYGSLLLQLPWALGVGAAAVAWLPRRSLADGLLLAGPIVLADRIEPGVGAGALACLALPLFALARRPRFAILLATALLAFFLAAVEVKLRFAGTPLTWPDMYFFLLRLGDNLGVLASQPTVLGYAALALTLLVFAAAAGWWWDGRQRSPVRLGASRAGALLALLLAAWCASDLNAQALELQRRGSLVLASWPPGVMRFIASAGLARWETPAVPTAWFSEEVRRQRRMPPAATPADIVVFLQESQFNPATIAGCPAPLCAHPVFGADAATRAHGPLRVHTFGGGTWLTEFALAAGVPHTQFGPAGAFAPFNVAGGVQRSFARSLREAGYRTVALYPVPGGMMNARNAYAAYGFDRFYDSSDVGLSGTYDTSDARMHETALQVLQEERKQGRPVFLLVVTIFNHSEHGRELARVPQALLAAARSRFHEEADAENLADYLWRTQAFAQALERTGRAVLQAERPVVLAWFGDHLPAFGKAPGLLRRMGSAPAAAGRIPPQFQTWYRMDSNVNALPAQARSQALDIVFFPGLLAEAAGAPLDDWLAANVVGRRLCDGLLEGCVRDGAREAYLSYLQGDLHAFALP